MEYTLTKRQKQIQAHRAIKKFIVNEFTSKVLNELKNVINDEKTPSEWFNEENNELKNSILKKYCLNCDKLE